MKLLGVVGARPNFRKMAPLCPWSRVDRALDEIWERPPSGSQPEGRDGRAGERVAEDLLRG